MAKKKQKVANGQVAAEDLVSHHVFMLPFKISKKGEDGLFAQADFLQVMQSYGSADNKPRWLSEDFSLKELVNYNEYNYFYDYVRDILYQKESQAGKSDQYIRHFELEKQKGANWIYRIETPQPWYGGQKPTAESTSKIYQLEIDSILLHWYYTGVGVLSFHLHNRNYFNEQGQKQRQDRREDILYINQFGRRIFPPFYPIPNEKVGYPAAHEQTFVLKETDPRGVEIAQSISIDFGDGLDYSKPEKWDKSPPADPDELDDFKEQLPNYLKRFFGPLPQGFTISPVLDDRMFVVCWYGNDTLVAELAEQKNGKSVNQTVYDHDFWARYVYVDSKWLSVQNKVMREELLDKSSYLRWSGLGTYYGITDYSFVCLTGSLDSLRGEGVAYLLTHLQTIYYKMAELVLVQRACVQRFSDEVTQISLLPPERRSEIAEQAQELYQRYIRFVNRIYFREVTAQVQGVELYSLLHEQSRLRDAVESLHQEVHELHNYATHIHEKEQDDIAKRQETLLGVIGAVIAGPGLLYALFAVAGLPGENPDCASNIYPWSVGISLAIVLTSLYTIKRFRNPGPSIFTWLMVGFIAVLVFLPPWFFSRKSYCLPAAPTPVEETTSTPDIPPTPAEQPVLPSVAAPDDSL
ncbi:MAG: hypothetical protein AAF433_02260 [Bacteroidota bacterium]